MKSINDIIRSELLPYAAQRPDADPETAVPSEWCRNNLWFNEASYRGPFKTFGAEYVIEPLNLFADRTVSDVVLAWGSQTHKTGTIMGGAAWAIANDPSGVLWVMPSATLAKTFSKQRWQKMLLASKPFDGMIPTGAGRHDFASLNQIFRGGAVVNFTGSNSPASLSSNPCRRVILDEVDKFDEGGRGEADAVNLAEQRTKDQPDPQRWKTSTPTLYSGLIWQEMLKGDMRRCFLPCPSCSKLVVLVFSKQYTVLDSVGCEAYLDWDKEAKINAEWDLDRVERSAHYICPHCGFHILDSHKPEMLKRHEWRPTKSAPPSFRSYHLPSMYSTSQQCSAGKLAVKFLESKKSLLGLQGFINGDLAEPYMAQDTNRIRIEIVTDAVDSSAGVTLMTVDCQAKSPLFWYVVRNWNLERAETYTVSAGSCDTEQELEDIQRAHNIKSACIMLDSGFGAKSDAEVYRMCASHCEFVEQGDTRPVGIGWMPAKGMPNRRRWKDESGAFIPFTTIDIDPLVGTPDAGKVVLNLFQFDGNSIKDSLETLRAGVTKYKWGVKSDAASEMYWKHMDSEWKIATINRRNNATSYQWQLRAKSLPNHLFDCEVMQVAFAMYLGLITYK